MFRAILLTPVLIFSLFIPSAFADSASFQLSLTPDVAIESRTTNINGVALNIWGENPQQALTLGFINGSTLASSGVSLAFVANYAEDYSGAQVAWLGNYASGRLSGLQWGAFNYTKSLKGVQLGLVNFADNVEKGLQIGLVNVMNNNVYWFGGCRRKLPR